MRLRIGPAVTDVEYKNQVEQDSLRNILYLDDPNRHRDYKYRQGLWNGKRNYFIGKPMYGKQFPTGLLSYVLHRLQILSIVPEIVDYRPAAGQWDGEIPEGLLEGIELRDYQVEAIEAALTNRWGVIQAPPRAGKTAMMAAIAKILRQPTLILVPSLILLKQTKEAFERYGLEDIGVLGGGKESVGTYTICTPQTGARRLKEDKKFFDWARVLMGDEVHTLGTNGQWSDCFLGCRNTTHRLGFSGTPYRSVTGEWRHEDFVIQGHTGPLIYQITAQELMNQKHLAEAKVLMLPVPGKSYADEDYSGRDGTFEYGKAYDELITFHNDRNNLVCKVAAYLASKQGHKVLILVRRLIHGDQIALGLAQRGIQCVISSGGGRLRVVQDGEVVPVENTAAMRDAIKEGTVPCVIGTTIFDQGVDLPYLNTVLVAAGGKAETRTIQRAFRSLTKCGDKKSLVIDFLDEHHGLIGRHARNRIACYQKEGLPVTELDNVAEFPKQVA